MFSRSIWMATAVCWAAVLVLACEQEEDADGATRSESDVGPGGDGGDSDGPGGAGGSSDGPGGDGGDSDGASDQSGVKGRAGEPCVVDADCIDDYYCCPIFHYCVETCEELATGDTCPDTGYTCELIAIHQLCSYRGDGSELEDGVGRGGDPCASNDDCESGFSCAAILNYCVELCSEEGEPCADPGFVCAKPVIPLLEIDVPLTCLYQGE
jgi:hypothetical protein